MNATKSYYIARGFSEFGNALRQVVLALFFLSIRNISHDVQVAEVFETSGFISAMLFAPFFIDHFNKRKQLIFCDILSAIFSLVIITSHDVPIWIFFIAAAGLTGIGALHTASLNAIAQSQSGDSTKEKLLGIGRIQFAILLGALLGLMFGSQVIGKISYRILLAIDLGTFFFSSLWLALVIKPEASSNNQSTSKQNFKTFVYLRFVDWTDGFKLAHAKLEHRILLVASMINGIVVGMYEACSVIFQKQKLLGSDADLFYVRAVNRSLGCLALILMAYVAKKIINYGTREVETFLLYAITFAMLSFLFIPFSGMLGFYIFNGAYCLSMTIYYLCTSTYQSKLVSTDHLGKIESIRLLLAYLMVIVGNLLSIPLFPILNGAFPFVVGALLMLLLLVWWRSAIGKANRISATKL